MICFNINFSQSILQYRFWFQTWISIIQYQAIIQIYRILFCNIIFNLNAIASIHQYQYCFKNLQPSNTIPVFKELKLQYILQYQYQYHFILFKFTNFVLIWILVYPFCNIHFHLNLLNYNLKKTFWLQYFNLHFAITISISIYWNAFININLDFNILDFLCNFNNNFCISIIPSSVSFLI